MLRSQLLPLLVAGLLSLGISPLAQPAPARVLLREPVRQVAGVTQVAADSPDEQSTPIFVLQDTPLVTGLWEGLDRPRYQILSQDVTAQGGDIDLSVEGTDGICLGGRERFRIRWVFERDVSRLSGGDTIRAQVEGSTIARSAPCTGEIAYRTQIRLVGSMAQAGLEPHDEYGWRFDDDRFQSASNYLRMRTDGAPVVETQEVRVESYPLDWRPQSPDGWFKFEIFTPGGWLRYVYRYAGMTGPDTGGTSNIGGTWYREGDPNRPAQIQQSGGSLTFINENGGSSPGRFENPTTVVATGWEGGLRGRLSADGTRIDWANGSSWSR